MSTLSLCYIPTPQCTSLLSTHGPVPDPLGGTDLLSRQSAANNNEQRWPLELAHFDDIKDLLRAGALPGLLL